MYKLLLRTTMHYSTMTGCSCSVHTQIVEFSTEKEALIAFETITARMGDNTNIRTEAIPLW